MAGAAAGAGLDGHIDRSAVAADHPAVRGFSPTSEPAGQPHGPRRRSRPGCWVRDAAPAGGGRARGQRSSGDGHPAAGARWVRRPGRSAASGAAIGAMAAGDPGGPGAGGPGRIGLSAGGAGTGTAESGGSGGTGSGGGMAAGATTFGEPGTQQTGTQQSRSRCSATDRSGGRFRRCRRRAGHLRYRPGGNDGTISATSSAPAVRRWRWPPRPPSRTYPTNRRSSGCAASSGISTTLESGTACAADDRSPRARLRSTVPDLQSACSWLTTVRSGRSGGGASSAPSPARPRRSSRAPRRR